MYYMEDYYLSWMRSLCVTLLALCVTLLHDRSWCVIRKIYMSYKVIITVWYIVKYGVCYLVDYYGLQYRSLCVIW